MCVELLLDMFGLRMTAKRMIDSERDILTEITGNKYSRLINPTLLFCYSAIIEPKRIHICQHIHVFYSS